MAVRIGYGTVCAKRYGENGEFCFFVFGIIPRSAPTVKRFLIFSQKFFSPRFFFHRQKNFFFACLRHCYDIPPPFSYIRHKKESKRTSFFLLCIVFNENLAKKSFIFDIYKTEKLWYDIPCCSGTTSQHHAQQTKPSAEYQAYDITTRMPGLLCFFYAFFQNVPIRNPQFENKL